MTFKDILKPLAHKEHEFESEKIRFTKFSKFQSKPLERYLTLENGKLQSYLKAKNKEEY